MKCALVYNFSEQQRNQDLRRIYRRGGTNSRIHHSLPECIAFNQSALRHFLPECVAPRTTRGRLQLDRAVVFFRVDANEKDFALIYL